MSAFGVCCCFFTSIEDYRCTQYFFSFIGISLTPPQRICSNSHFRRDFFPVNLTQDLLLYSGRFVFRPSFSKNQSPMMFLFSNLRPYRLSVFSPVTQTSPILPLRLSLVSMSRNSQCHFLKPTIKYVTSFGNPPKFDLHRTRLNT